MFKNRRKLISALRHLTTCNKTVKIPVNPVCNCFKEDSQSLQESENIENYDSTKYNLFENVWAPERDISNIDQLMELTSEPIFITGKSIWQEKELRANTRELFICKHLFKNLTLDYLYYFIRVLIDKKQEYLNEQKINFPVTFYMWYGSWGHNNLNYDFISGNNIDLPFGKDSDGKGIIRDQIKHKTFIRNFLTKKSLRKKIHVITQVFNLGKEENTIEYSDDYLKSKYSKAFMKSSRSILIPNNILTN